MIPTMSTRHDAYNSVASHYDLHGWDWYARTFGPRLIALLRDRGLGAGAPILDAGCGTGSLCLTLAQAGFRMTGVDLSPRMIERAEGKDTAHQVEWQVGDITSLALGATFDAVVSVTDVFNHFESLDEWELALRSLSEHLRPGGLVFVDAQTCRGLEQMDGQSALQRDGVTLIQATVYEPAVRRSTIKVTSFAPSADHPGLYERAQDTITAWGQPVADVLCRFTRAGFSEIERVWAKCADPEDNSRLVVVGKR
jgi:SAM-dependent methyltransferase